MATHARRTRFDTTHWSMVIAAGGSESEPARRALASLCETYWYPLYGYARQQGCTAEDARDITQSFFAALIERRDIRTVRPDLGRFRSFLLAAFRHFMLDEFKRARTLKRGGGRLPIQLELESAERRYVHEPLDHRTPEALFDRRWAWATLERVIQDLRAEWSEAGKLAEFDALKASLMGQNASGGYDALASTLDTTPGAIKVAVHRLRKVFGLRLREHIAETVETDAEVEEEIQHLLNTLRS